MNFLDKVRTLLLWLLVTMGIISSIGMFSYSLRHHQYFRKDFNQKNVIAVLEQNKDKFSPWKYKVIGYIGDAGIYKQVSYVLAPTLVQKTKNAEILIATDKAVFVSKGYMLWFPLGNGIGVYKRR